MSHDRETALWAQLTAAGLARGEFPAASAPGQAWYIRAMLIFSGWLAAAFMLLFLGFLSIAIFQDHTLSLILGGLILIGAYALMRFAGDGDFVQQLSLATALAGKTLFLYGLAGIMKGSMASFWVQLGALEILLIIIFPSYLHRIICTLGAAVATSGLLFELGALQLSTALAALAFVLLWLNERRWADRNSLWAPVAVAMALVLTIWDTPAMIKSGQATRLLLTSQQTTVIHFAIVLQIAAWVTLCAGLLQRTGIALKSSAGISVLVAATALGALAWWAPGFLPALMVLAVGFGSGQRFLAGLGLFALVAFLSGYYYNLEATLLVKSIVLAISGAVLLMMRFVPVLLGRGEDA